MERAVESPEAVGFSSERLARITPVMQAYVDDARLRGGVHPAGPAGADHSLRTGWLAGSRESRPRSRPIRSTASIR